MFDADDDLEQQYQNLTDKQRAVIDAHAERPDETNRKKTEIAEDKLGDSINESYASQVINKKYPKLAKYREEIEQNQRQEGQMKTEGDPFSAIPQDDSGFQSIQDRPVTETESGNGHEEQEQEEPQERSFVPPRQHVQIEKREGGVLIWMDDHYLRQILKASVLPEELHSGLVDAVLENKFN